MPRSNPARSSTAARAPGIAAPPQPNRRRPPAHVLRTESSSNELLAVEVLASGFQLAPGDFAAPDEDPNIKDTRRRRSARKGMAVTSIFSPAAHDPAAPSLDDCDDPAAAFTLPPVASAGSLAPRTKRRRLAPPSPAMVGGQDHHPMIAEKKKATSMVTRAATSTIKTSSCSSSSKIKRGTSKGKQIYVGSCSNEEAGARIYDRAYIKFRGQNCPNFPYSDYVHEIPQWINLPDKEFITMLRQMSRGKSLIWFTPDLLGGDAGFPRTRETRPRASNYRGVYRLKKSKCQEWAASITLDSRFDWTYDQAVIRFFGKAKALNFTYEDYTDEMPQIKESSKYIQLKELRRRGMMW
ncbi:AP2-like ethylene-responsive transcription factor At1g79700 [Selaginella moellendorffii]|uniref:AP2-like ethylene-responsive transcription factor At1g79700 n=1 Tax=Selaginella moellendorffii TaxID=88036 RepID=UPI000D1CDCFD|nr:AP2-like ethylene-responsive transcription factor At1g79700 [Selaginella moellendorffii]|eukprot:XP_024534825.1 AP2-like ethylene-responsive transcription factor At1g79700 [Selaginella moellendorffii]